MISIAHRPAVEQFHARLLTVEEGKLVEKGSA
jgi:ABC-type uncharacterized transport system fused permease/ATPase subunit